MTQKQIETAAAKVVANNEDLQILSSIEWLHDAGLMEWKQYCQIKNAITKAWHTVKQPA